MTGSRGSCFGATWGGVGGKAPPSGISIFLYAGRWMQDAGRTTEMQNAGCWMLDAGRSIRSGFGRWGSKTGSRGSGFGAGWGGEAPPFGNLDFPVCRTHEAGLRTQDTGRRMRDAGRWKQDAGCWTLDAGRTKGR